VLLGMHQKSTSTTQHKLQTTKSLALVPCVAAAATTISLMKDCHYWGLYLQVCCSGWEC
jgi:hypothetical protein